MLKTSLTKCKKIVHKPNTDTLIKYKILCKYTSIVSCRITFHKYCNWMYKKHNHVIDQVKQI